MTEPMTAGKIVERADPFTDLSKTGIFRDHRCWKCNDGERPCVQSRPGLCEYPHARND
jgi:hypothetical protein